MQAQRFHAWFHDKYLPSEEAIEIAARAQTREDEARARLQRMKQSATALQQRRDLAAQALSACLERQGEIACEIACRETDVIQQERQIMTNEASIERIRSDHLAARRSALQRDHDKWVDRLATLRKDLADAIPAQLAQTMAAIQTAHHREGLVVVEGAPSATTAGDPVFAPLFARRTELLERRHAMEQEALQVRAAIERVESAMLALKSESAEAVPTRSIHVPEQAEEIRLLAEACDRARRELGIMQHAKSTLEEQLRQCVQQVRERTEAHDHECEACRTMQAAVRQGESSLAGVTSTFVA